MSAGVSPGPGARWPAAPDLDALRRELAAVPDAGRLLPLGLGLVVTGPGCAGALAGVLPGRPGSPVVVLAAATPMSAGGQDLRAVVEQGLRPLAVKWVVLGPPDGLVHADAATVAAARAAAAGAGCVVAVGSGTVTDIGKAAAPAGTPLVCVQTAASVNGFAGPFSVLLRDGVKRTTSTRWADVLVIDSRVLQDAPAGLNRAGAGDLMAMFTAGADWYLASAVLPGRPAPGSCQGPARPASAHPGDPPYHPAVCRLTRSKGEQLLDLAAGLRAQPGGAELAGLAGLLTLSGVAMGVAGATAPASGLEHAVSHLLEMAATARGEAADMHGAQVGVASIVAARAWEHVLGRVACGALHRRVVLPDPDEVSRRIGRAFCALDPSGAMAAECFADYARKLRRLSGDDPLAGLRAAWDAHSKVLAGLLAEPAAIAGAVAAAGLPARFGDLAVPVDDDTARWATSNCALMRQRFGVADLAMLLGAWQDEDVEQVLAGTLGSGRT